MTIVHSMTSIISVNHWVRDEQDVCLMSVNTTQIVTNTSTRRVGTRHAITRPSALSRSCSWEVFGHSSTMK